MDLNQYLKVSRIPKSVFAKSIGISRATLSNYLAYKRNPTAFIAMKILEATGGKVTLKDLIKK